MKASQYIKSKIALLLIWFSCFLKWSERHKKMTVPIAFALLIATGYVFVSSSIKIAKLLTSDCPCGTCGTEDTKDAGKLLKQQEAIINSRRKPASIPDYFKNNAENAAKSDN